MVAAAIIGAAVVGAAGSMAAGNAQKGAAKDAASATERSADKQLAFQREARQEAKTALTPYVKEGDVARARYNAGVLGIGTTGQADLDANRAAYNTNFEASPYWQDAQYATNQGVNALMSTNAALGRGSSINSGKALRGASDINLANRAGARSQYNTALSGLIDTGYQASTGIASGGQTFANAATNILANATNQQNQYNLAGANALAGAYGNAAGFAGWGLGQMANYYQQPSTYMSNSHAASIPAAQSYNIPGLT